MKPELEEHYPLRKAVEILGVHPVTLRRWEKEGKIRYIRTPSGQRHFPRSEILRLVGETIPSGRRAVIYARISSAKQAGSGNLERQRQRLEEYCRSRWQHFKLWGKLSGLFRVARKRAVWMEP